MAPLMLLMAIISMISIAFVVYHGIQEIQRDKGPPEGRSPSKGGGTHDILNDSMRKRYEAAMHVLERHPDLTGNLGMPVSNRYRDQVESLIARYEAAGGGKDAYALLDRGMTSIEGKIVTALGRKTDSRTEDLKIYVRFLDEAD